MKSITLRLEDELHKQIKLKTVQEETTIQEYIVSLIKKDMKIKDKK